MTHNTRRFKIQHISQGIIPTDADRRTLIEKAADDAMNKQHLLINSALNTKDSFAFVKDMESFADRAERQAKLNKWQAYANLFTVYAKYKAHPEARVFRLRLNKASEAASEAGWTVEWNRYNAEIVAVYWPTA